MGHLIRCRGMSGPQTDGQTRFTWPSVRSQVRNSRNDRNQNRAESRGGDGAACHGAMRCHDWHVSKAGDPVQPACTAAVTEEKHVTFRGGRRKKAAVARSVSG